MVEGFGVPGQGFEGKRHQGIPAQAVTCKYKAPSEASKSKVKGLGFRV